MARRVAIAVSLLLLLTAALLTGVSSARPAAQTPNLKQMVLRQSDVPGSRIIRQGYIKDADYVATYEREFDGGLYRSLRLDNVESDLSYAKGLSDAKLEMLVMRKMFGPGATHKSIEGVFKQEATSEPGSVLKSVVVLRHRNVRLGDDGFEVVVRVRTTDQPAAIDFSIMAFRTDRMLGTLFLGGVPGRSLRPGDAFLLAKVFEGRVQAGLDAGL